MSWLSHQWFTWWWSSDKGNGPENIQWTILALIAASFLIPAVRNFFKRLESKVDHVITNHPDIPEYDEAKAEFEKWEHWLVTLVKSLSKRRSMTKKNDRRFEALHDKVDANHAEVLKRLEANQTKTQSLLFDHHVDTIEALKPKPRVRKPVKKVAKKAAPAKKAAKG